jgi:hypothetical protein
MSLPGTGVMLHALHAQRPETVEIKAQDPQ